MSKLKKFIFYGLAGLFFIALPVGALAFGYQISYSNYVGENEIIDGNYIKAGNIIEINGAVNGDVIVAGSSINITGSVAGDVFAAGNNVKISGPVSGSVRVMGSTVEINNEVARNGWAIGSGVVLNQAAKVGWDVFAAGSTVEVRGPVGGNVWAAGSTVLAANEIGKDLTAAIDREGRAILLPTAKVAGNFNYRAAGSEQLEIQDGAVIGGELIQQELPAAGDFDLRPVIQPLAILFKIVVLFSLLVVGLILISLVPKIALNVHEKMIKNFWPALGVGLVYLLVTPVVMVLLMFTVIGIPLALMILPLYLISLYLSKVFVGLSVGLLIVNNWKKGKKYQGTLVWPLVLGLVVFVVVGSLPLIGWLIKLVAMCWALGALLMVKRNLLKEFR